MKRIVLIVLIFINHKSFSQNLQLRANLDYGFVELANIYGYVDTVGNEYALVGTTNGVDIVDVTVPTSPNIRFSIPGPSSEWREIKTYRKFAYITTEGGSGLTIVDMSHLPDTIYYKHYTGDGPIIHGLFSIHALHCDTAKGFLYLYGTNIDYGNSLFLDLKDPWNPKYAGSYIFPGDADIPYVHDGYVLNDTMYEAHIWTPGFVAIVDVRDKSNPVLLATQTTPTAFVHNTWLSDDHHTLFTTDENPYSFLTAYDISDLNNIKELSRFQTAPGTGAIVHNTHILNDYAVTSWYKEGVVIVDEARPRNPIEVAHYDTYPSGSGAGYFGCWGVYPYLPSGNIIASDINNGLFVFTPTYVRGCYLEGTVSDSVTSALLSGALIEILSTSVFKTSDEGGEYRTGTAVAGTYEIRVSKNGYFTKTLTGIQLSNGILTPLNILLSPLITNPLSGSVTDSISGLPVENVKVIIEGNGLTFTGTSDSNGIISFPSIIPGSYIMVIGKWGYHTTCSTLTVVPGTTLTAKLAPGYFDDFTFDFGWTVNGTSPNSWERGDPIGTYDNFSTEINPEYDVTTDCGSFCFVTDNGGAPYNAHDVSNGNTILSSPLFDASVFADPYINYFRRFIELGGLNQPNDSMIVRLSNGIDTVSIETIDAFDIENGSWVGVSLPITSLISPTSTMQISIEVFDKSPDNIVEGAFDQFEITGQLFDKINKVNKDGFNFYAYPNPFSNDIIINYNLPSYIYSSVVSIKDLTGRIIYRQTLSESSGQIHLPKNLTSGIYLVVLENDHETMVRKIVKE